MSLLRTSVLVLAYALASVGCTSDHSEEQRVWEDESVILELVDLSRADRSALLAAPKLTMNYALSKELTLSNELSDAIRIGSVAGIKVQRVRDKVDGKVVDQMPPTHQGWIYYEPITLADGTPHTPTVLCISQSEEIQWFHCQDMSGYVSKLPFKIRTRQTDR